MHVHVSSCISFINLALDHEDGGTRIMDILRKVEKYREEEERLKWEGTFAEYLQLLKEKPWIAQTAHSRPEGEFYFIETFGTKNYSEFDYTDEKRVYDDDASMYIF